MSEKKASNRTGLICIAFLLMGIVTLAGLYFLGGTNVDLAFASKANAATQPPESPISTTIDLTEVRVFEGRNVHTMEMLEQNGNVIWTGTYYDCLMTVDPIIHGERVYLRDKNNQKVGAFVYLDQLDEIQTGIVFRVKPNTNVMLDNGRSSADGLGGGPEEKPWTNGQYVIVNGKALDGWRVDVTNYFNNDAATTPTVHFLNRTDLELVSYRPKDDAK